jgi:hypothetical protein
MHSPWLGQLPAGTTQTSTGAKVIVTSHRLPESERLLRLSFCTVCENNQRGICLKCQHCSGKLIDHKVRAVMESCPLQPPKWKAWIEPMSVEIKGYS